jgi:hypothetical protein
MWWHAALFKNLLTEHTTNIVLISSWLPLGKGPSLGCRAGFELGPALQQGAGYPLALSKEKVSYFVSKEKSFSILHNQNHLEESEGGDLTECKLRRHTVADEKALIS